jgi:hypothetical protein
LNMPNATPENSVDITSLHLGTDESSNAPNHYTWHNRHISPLQRLAPMSDITKQEIIPSPYQPETIIDVMDETSTDELCCICLVSQEKLYCFAKLILSFIFALQFLTDCTFAMKKNRNLCMKWNSCTFSSARTSFTQNVLLSGSHIVNYTYYARCADRKSHMVLLHVSPTRFRVLDTI